MFEDLRQLEQIGWSEDEISYFTTERMKRIVQELTARKMEALELYRPQPEQDRFHRSKAFVRMVRGGNRSGKSTCGYVEDARAVLGKDPHKKYPTNRPIVCYIVGMDERFIGDVIHKMLFRPGAFQLIRDLKTGQLRAFRGFNDPEDGSRASECVEAPPLIPPRYLLPGDRSFAWEVKKAGIFNSCKLSNGAVIQAFSSKADPAQGTRVSLAHIDEDVSRGEWLDELLMRLPDWMGVLTWTLKPHMRNDAARSLSDQAVAQKGTDNPHVEEFQLTFSGNQYISQEAKDRAKATLSPEVLRERDLGEFPVDSILMYPDFDMHKLGVPNLEAKSDFDLLLTDSAVPDDWARFMVVDPGYSTCAVLFAAMPPPTLGDFVVLFDELYLKECTAEIFGESVAKVVRGMRFRDFLIDHHGSRSHDAGLGIKLRHQYMEALARHRVRSERTGHDFFEGSGNTRGREAKLRTWMRPGKDGLPRLRVMRGRLPNLEKEMRRYRRRFDGSFVLDEPAPRQPNHLINCLEYLAAHDPTYSKPLPRVEYSPAYEAYLKREAAKRERSGTSDTVVFAAGMYPG